MRIALVHSFYSSAVPSGENQVVLAQAAALREAGHEVLLLARHTDAESIRAGYPVRAALQVVTGIGPDPAPRLRRFRPDIVHVHNMHPNIGTRWLTDWPGPLVATLHNFRPLCSSGLLFRDGAICTACPDGHRWAGLEHACYHNSRLATLPLAVHTARGLHAHPVVRRADVVVVLSELVREVYERYGADPGRFAVVPNGVDRRHEAAGPAPEDERWVWVGRLSPEKGVAELAAEWPTGRVLDVIGDGPQAGLVAGPGVRRLGPLPRDQVRGILSEYTGLVFSSRCYEGSPLVVSEALEAGLPVVALEGSGAAALVARHGAGAVYGDSPGLESALAAVASRGDAGRLRARAVYESLLSESAWVDALVEVYEQAAHLRREGKGSAPTAD